MLAGVLLHVVKAPLPVQLSGDGRALLQRPVAGVDNDAAALLHIADLRIAQRAVVGALTAALGVKGSAVQRHMPCLALRDTAQHRGVKAAQIRIVFV